MGLVTHRECVLVFAEEREIIDLLHNDGEVWQAPDVDLASDLMTPGVKAMTAGYGAELAGDMIQRGRPDGKGVYARLGPGSGFPYILIGDLRMFQKGPNRCKWHPELVKVGHTWTRIPRYQHPIALPPKAAYWSPGLTSDYARYPIGGWVSDEDTDYLWWICNLEVDEDPNLQDAGSHSGWQFHTKTQLLADSEDKILYSPAFPLIPSANGAEDQNDSGEIQVFSPLGTMTNITLRAAQLTLFAETFSLIGITTAELDSAFGGSDGAPGRTAATWWAAYILADFKAENANESGDLQAYSSVRYKF